MKRDRILLAHGGGGSLTRELISAVVAPALDNPWLRPLDDAAVVEMGGQRLAITTDSYVVHPRFFPGGDIGTLAVCGTVNDLATQGAEPLWLSLGLILEEGLPIAELERVIASIKAAAAAAGVAVVTGDTKVVERGRGDGVYINTTGIGRVVARTPLGASRAQPGDAVLLTGPIGAHGIAVLSQREGFGFATSIVSDCAALWPLVKAILDAGVDPHTIRDLTRGGLAAGLCEIAEAARVGLAIEENAIPVDAEVQGACELLGLDPLTIANEGKLLVVCAAADADRTLAALRGPPLGSAARRIGTVTGDHPGLAVLRTLIGGERIIDMPTGEDLPRIC